MSLNPTFTLILGAIFFFSPQLCASDYNNTKARSLLHSFSDKGFSNIRNKQSGTFNDKGKAYIYATLIEGERYVAVAAAESSQQNIKIYIFNASLKKMPLRCISRNGGASLEYKPDKTGKYLFFLSEKNGGKYTLFLASQRSSKTKK